MILHASSKKSIIAQKFWGRQPGSGSSRSSAMPEFRDPLSLDLILNILSVLDGFLVYTQLPACLLI